MSDHRDQNRVIEAIRNVVGAGAVEAGDETLGRYARSTDVRATRPLAIVYPAETREVVALTRVARETGNALYPISAGRNWGYGDATAPHAGQIIVDLRRMNRIVEVHERLAYAVIEPGVTQGQLSSYLSRHHPSLWMDATGAGHGASFVGNTLDRGFGHTPYGDHFMHTCGMEVVLADGRILRTGYGHYAGAKAARVYRHGVGPSLDGLFAQSNLGIVTQIGMWLMPAPEAFTAFFLRARSEEDLADLVERLAPLRLSGLLASAVHIGNDLRVLSGRMRYPFDRTGGSTPLPMALRQTLRKEIGMGAWNATGSVMGDARVVAAARGAIKHALRPHKVVFLDDRRLAMLQRVGRAAGRFGAGLREKVDTLAPLIGLLKGQPTDEPLHGASWRVRDPLPAEPRDPLETHAGLLWLAPVVPATGAHATEVMHLIEPIYARFGFDTLVTFTLITGRAMICITNVSFDKRIEEEAAAAVACYETLWQALRERGYYPYRTSVRGFASLGVNSTVFWDVVGQIKQALDPQRIIAPGRYEAPRPA